jgi:hypothetical protein
MKSIYTRFFISLFVIAVVATAIFFALRLAQGPGSQATSLKSGNGIWNSFMAKRKLATVSKSAYFTAGFSIIKASDAFDASNDGIQQAFMYGGLYSEDSQLGRTFKTLHIKQVDGEISSYLYAYECHRLYQQHLDIQKFCSQDYPGMDHQQLIDLVKGEIARAKKTTLRAGYWILDDWPASDEGSAKSLLPEIAGIIHTQDPGMPAICGFGAELGAGQHDLLAPGVVKNYSPGGCDVVGIYIYSESVTDPTTPPSTFDWSMSTLLPAMLNGLSQQGWDPNKIPFMGIVQAWAGTRMDAKGYYEIAPRAQDIVQQSISFCKNGAQGINYYGWNSSMVRNIQTPANNAQIKQGVLKGIQACKNYWGLA